MTLNTPEKSDMALASPKMESPGPGKTTRVAPLPQSRMRWRKAYKYLCPKKLCNTNLLCTQLFVILKRCKTFATSSGLQMPNFFLIFSLAFSASGIPSLGVLRVGKVKRL